MNDPCSKKFDVLVIGISVLVILGSAAAFFFDAHIFVKSFAIGFGPWAFYWIFSAIRDMRDIDSYSDLRKELR